MHSDNSFGSDHDFSDGVGSLELNGRAAGPGGGGSSGQIKGLITYGKDSDHGLPGVDLVGDPEAVPNLVLLRSQGGEPGTGEKTDPGTGEDDGESWQKKIEVIGRKCACGNVWCERCRKGVPAQRMKRAMERFNWRTTRHVTTTIDPKRWESAESAFDWMMEHKAIPQFIRDLRRTQGVIVTDYWWCLEWHKNGYPHWHILIETDRVGMIHGDVLRAAWKYGRVNEAPIKTQKQWLGFVGYVGKSGYLEKKKAHQARLPEWAKKRPTGSIRKMGGMTDAARAKYKPAGAEWTGAAGAETDQTDRVESSATKTAGIIPQQMDQANSVTRNNQLLGWITDDMLSKMDSALIGKLDREHNTGGALMSRYHELMGWDDLEPESGGVTSVRSYEGAFELCGAYFDVCIPTCQFQKGFFNCRVLPAGFWNDAYYEFRVFIAYDEFKAMGQENEYIEGVGLSRWLSVDDVLFLLKHEYKQRTDIMIDKVG